MGFSRLLLLLLCVILVSLAIVVGINAYTDNTTKANFDSLTQDSITMATNAQAWKSRPQMLGGSPDIHKTDPEDYTGATFLAIGYTAIDAPTCYRNSNGEFAITPTDDGLLIVGSNVSDKNRIVVLVNGTTDNKVTVLDGPTNDRMSVMGGYSLGTHEAITVTTPSPCTD